jgi:CSLREA domain-containing protein
MGVSGDYGRRVRARLARFTPPMALATIAALLLSLLPLVTSPARAATILVTGTADVLADDGQCTLREAIIAANSDTPSGLASGECVAGSGSDTITVPAGMYTLTLAGVGEDAAATGDLDLTSDVTIAGAGAGTTIVDGNGAALGDRVFDIPAGANVALTGLTVRGGVIGFADGAGIRALGIGGLGLQDVTIVGNTTTSDGGGIYRAGGGSLAIEASVIAGNGAGGNGGGINQSGGTLTATASTIRGNFAGTSGGGLIYEGGAATVTRSTISGNTADASPGGIANAGAMLIVASTISGNVSAGGEEGGGIRTTGGTLALIASTIATNSTGLYALGGVVTARNSIVANSTAGVNCSGAVVNGGNNIDSGSSCGFGAANNSLSDTDPRLNPLAVNAPGTTATHALQPGSPAIDLVPQADANCTGTDQRGVPRPQPAGWS